MSEPTRAPVVLPGHRLRDGAPVNVDLKEYLVGREIMDVDCRGLTEEGYNAVKFTFLGGDELLAIARPVPPAMRERTGFVTEFQFLFLPQQARRILLPGVRP